MSLRSHAALVASAFLLVMLAAACAPDPGPPATTTTTTSGLPVIATGCHDGGGSDIVFNGPMDALRNGELHSTSNGSCGAFVIWETFVQSTTKAGADALCASLGGTVASLVPLGANGYATLGNTVWECSGLH
ncbi:hypothetical protein [Dermatobacter hominis]|uniref:hypothetical protein n=1 Tax=Dermatobacter hominis TaxID=2884263 RepID=UPI001D1010AA|nr:hypothetical protein [Dermatobacter hominis]UDY37634.1 hypothetical protein LH044_08860 [Dermatobacter hominis]